MITYLTQDFEYQGEVDENGKPCGFGVAKDGICLEVNGTWLDG